MNQYTKAYSSTATYSGVAYADPHSLITQMFDGALKRIAQARGCLERKEYAAKVVNIRISFEIMCLLDCFLNMYYGV